MQIIDRKFKFVATNPCKNSIYTEENAIVFCAKDKALSAALSAYRFECIRLQCGKEHIESIDLLRKRVFEFQRDIKCKTPDTETECEIDRCINGKL